MARMAVLTDQASLPEVLLAYPQPASGPAAPLRLRGGWHRLALAVARCRSVTGTAITRSGARPEVRGAARDPGGHAVGRPVAREDAVSDRRPPDRAADPALRLPHHHRV